MSYSHHPVHTYVAKASRFAPQASLAMGGVGAIVGGTAAAARNIRRVKGNEIDREEAVRDTIREAAGAGLAATAATAMVTAVGATGVFSLLGILAVATGTKYIWDSAALPAKASAEEPPKAAKTSKPRPTTKK